ncbi:adenylate/guanylate cyclase domain-containing protein, partial [Leptolyngbya sp. FACHB-36]|uniref:adenylate/guanylate cyclase domain-containing protein n=1 Tax=Leptolyngbya sp. FACHB-36 TaxID=2692808 RepID=UPI001F55A404
MSVDENQTLRLIHRDLKLMKRLCEQFEGRVLKSTGDGLLMHFISAVKAVECAIAIQTSLAAAAEGLTSNDVLKHRIGIHLADIFITETDVMGNGVNIAARLQAAADPGGICVSQTVYDVVKAGLDIRTRYLGPQELKNIREVVPVYKILLTAEDEILDEYTDVVRRLEQSQNLHRIKKLLFYICNKVWENDPQRIDLLDLRQLIHGLVEQAPTLDRLRTLLTASVKTLSKRAEYSLVANVITHEVWKLYRSGEVLSGPLSEEAPFDDNHLETAPYEPIAQTLEQAEPSARLKKLMFYVCNNR